LPLHLAELSYRHNNRKNPDTIRISLQNAEHAAAEACSDEIQSGARPTPLAHGGLMPKAKPVSLFPLSFEQVIDVLMKAKPKPQKKRRSKKSKKSV
jgi:hypothetical protein